MFLSLSIRSTPERGENMKLENEERLVKRAMKYDEKAIIRLFDHYKEYLYRIAYMYYKNEQDALDAVSECVTKVYINFPKLKHPEYFKTWMTRILINEVFADIKKNKKHISYDNLKEVGYEAEYPEDFISREEKMDLYAALNMLKPDYRIALILKYFEELSIKEISEIMGCSESNIKALLHRGRKKLHKILMEDMAYEA